MGGKVAEKASLWSDVSGLRRRANEAGWEIFAKFFKFELLKIHIYKADCNIVLNRIYNCGHKGSVIQTVHNWLKKKVNDAPSPRTMEARSSLSRYNHANSVHTSTKFDESNRWNGSTVLKRIGEWHWRVKWGQQEVYGVHVFKLFHLLNGMIQRRRFSSNIVQYSACMTFASASKSLMSLSHFWTSCFPSSRFLWSISISTFFSFILPSKTSSLCDSV
jgi:hypothetical protein